MGQSESDLGWYLQEKGLFSDPSRIWGAVPSHPGQVEGIENSGRVSKQIIILHEELVLKSGTVQNCKILLTSWLASYSISTTSMSLGIIKLNV